MLTLNLELCIDSDISLRDNASEMLSRLCTLLGDGFIRENEKYALQFNNLLA